MSITALILDPSGELAAPLTQLLEAEGFAVRAETGTEEAVAALDDAQVKLLLLGTVPKEEEALRLLATLLDEKHDSIELAVLGDASALPEGYAERAGLALDAAPSAEEFPEALVAGLQQLLGETYPAPPTQVGTESMQVETVSTSQERFADRQSRTERSEVEREARKAFSGRDLVSGQLNDVGFAELLLRLYRERATGALFVRSEDTKKIIYLRTGQPISVKSNRLGECLGNLLVRERVITEEECEESLRRMRVTREKQGTILVEMGCISPHNLFAALVRQLEEKLYDVISWEGGDYVFDPSAAIPPTVTTFEQNTPALVEKGVRRYLRPDRLTGLLNEEMEQVGRIGAEPLRESDELSTTPEEGEFINLLLHGGKLSEAIESGPLDIDDALKLAYALKVLGIVEFSDQPPAPEPAEDAAASGPVTELALPAARPALDVAAAPAPELDDDVATVSLKAVEPPDWYTGNVDADQSEAGEGSEASDWRDNPEAAASELRARVQELRRKDYFEVLGLPREAEREEVEKAYVGLARELHPDRNYRDAPADLQEPAEELYALVSRAYETLSKDDEREAYRATLGRSDKPAFADEMSRLLQAEGHFQRGCRELGRNRLRDATRLLQQAVDTYPDEAEFHAWLGWALAQGDAPPATALRNAREELAQAARLNPRLFRTHLFLGLIAHREGETQRAREALTRAVELNPDSTDAVDALASLTLSPPPPPPPDLPPEPPPID